MSELVPQSAVDPDSRRRDGSSSTPPIALARAHVSRHLSRRLPYYLTPEEAHRLIDITQNDRDHVLLRVLWETGVRISEAINIKRGDVGRDGIRVLGKGTVERVVFVQDGLVTEILFYAQERTLGRDDFLFPSRKGGHITKQRADQIIKRAAHRTTPSISSTVGVAWTPYSSNWGIGTSTLLASTCDSPTRISSGKWENSTSEEPL